MDAFIRPALAELARRGTPFRGVLFAGLMLTADGPRLIEYNVRFGDPECQALLPLLRSDLLPGLVAACDGELGSFDLRWRDGACVAVVMAAEGYPAAPELDTVIDGLEAAAAVPGALVFQAGTRVEDGRLLAAGGRALTICGTGAGPGDGAGGRVRGDRPRALAGGVLPRRHRRRLAAGTAASGYAPAEGPDG